MNLLTSATVTFFLGVFARGSNEPSLQELVLLAAFAVILGCKLLSARPFFLSVVGYASLLTGLLSIVWAYTVVPLLYYYSLWGFGGLVLGVIANLLLPTQLLLFLLVALVAGGSASYVAGFVSGLLFGLSGCLLGISTFTHSIWKFQVARQPPNTDIIDAEFTEIRESARLENGD